MASTLKNVEVSDYEGSNLSSLDDFRENSILGPQTVDIQTYKLEISGLVESPLIYTYNEAIDNFEHYRKTVRLNCVEGWSVNILWEGIQVRDIIARSKLSEKAVTVIFHAVDGYTTSFPVGYIMENPIIMAYRMNDQLMPEERGYPFQLVAESKWGYKWIKWINQIELSDNPDYKGFWESRGYSNTGDLDKRFYNR